MSIKYNNKVIAGKYKEQIIPFANTIDAGIAKIATQEEINEGIDNTSIVTPVYLAQKQDKLIAGDGININEANIISSKITPDKVTIVENENNTISTVARKTVNESIIYDWEGTEAEYHQALMNGEINPDWYCYITDDELSVSYNDVLSRTLINIAPDGEEVIKDLSEKNLSKKITNCITELPQKIKLELTDGVLTLKKGSKVIVPNGANVFNEVVVPSDVVFHDGTIGTDTFDVMLFCNLKGGFGFRTNQNLCVSGATAPSDTLSIWYDTTNNMVKGYENGAWVQKYSLPIGIYYRKSGKATAIKQIFNNVGYIGSTLFINKDIKYLVPNGRNNDGTLNNIECTTSIKTTVSGNNEYIITLNSYGGLSRIAKSTVFIQETAPANPVDTITSWFKPSDNQWYRYTDNAWAKIGICPIGEFIGDANTKITDFNPKEAFSAVDYNDYKNDLDTLNSTLSNTTNILDNTKVNKAGDTMTGSLISEQSGYYQFVAKSTVIDSTVTPTSTQHVGIDFKDKNNVRLGWFGICHDKSGATYASLLNFSGVSDGFMFPRCTTKATTTSTASNYKVAVVVQNYVNGTSWYRVWSDGWIEQGGYLASAANTGTAVSLLKAFSDTNYNVQVTPLNKSNNAHIGWATKTNANQIALYSSANASSAGGLAVNWYACGY